MPAGRPALAARRQLERSLGRAGSARAARRGASWPRPRGTRCRRRPPRCRRRGSACRARRRAGGRAATASRTAARSRTAGPSESAGASERARRACRRPRPPAPSRRLRVMRAPLSATICATSALVLGCSGPDTPPRAPRSRPAACRRGSARRRAQRARRPARRRAAASSAADAVEDDEGDRARARPGRAAASDASSRARRRRPRRDDPVRLLVAAALAARRPREQPSSRASQMPEAVLASCGLAVPMHEAHADEHEHHRSQVTSPSGNGPRWLIPQPPRSSGCCA